MAESEEFYVKIVKWKSGLEAKGLKMNTGKRKVMFSCSKVYVRRELYSILCHGCKKWIHKRCSGVPFETRNLRWCDIDSDPVLAKLKVKLKKVLKVTVTQR